LDRCAPGSSRREPGRGPEWTASLRLLELAEVSGVARSARISRTILAMEQDHHHECLDCADVWLCVSDCVPLRLALCARCAERRQRSPRATIRVIDLPPGTWSRSVARPLLAGTEEILRQFLQRGGK
jgi:hypothetical protein